MSSSAKMRKLSVRIDADLKASFEDTLRGIGVDPTWLVASNSLGVSAGKMLSPQNIAIGCAACGLVGKDGEILGKIAKYAFGFAIAMAILVYVGSLVL